MKTKVPEIVLTRFAAVQDHDESTGKEEDVRIRKRMKRKMSEFRKKMKRMSEFRKRMKRMMNPQMKRKITPHQSGYFSEPSGLETPK
jgi:hypothetical protein